MLFQERERVDFHEVYELLPVPISLNSFITLQGPGGFMRLIHLSVIRLLIAGTGDPSANILHSSFFQYGGLFLKQV